VYRNVAVPREVPSIGDINKLLTTARLPNTLAVARFHCSVVVPTVNSEKGYCDVLSRIRDCYLDKKELLK